MPLLDLEAVADVVVMSIEKALTPLLERMAAAEARLSVLGDLRDRVVVVETKAAMPQPVLEQREPDTLADLRARVAFMETRALDESTTKEIANLRERLAIIETRAPVPGPAGKDGRDGEPGPPGKDGTDGLAGLSFEGVYQEGQSYTKGNLVTWAGSSWHCNEATTTKPGDGSKDWTLMVKRGRDGKDGRDGHDLVPVVKVS